MDRVNRQFYILVKYSFYIKHNFLGGSLIYFTPFSFFVLGVKCKRKFVVRGSSFRVEVVVREGVGEG